MIKAALALTPAVMLGVALGLAEPAVADTPLPCNALCRAWMGVSDPPPPPPQAMIELHPALEAVSAGPPPSAPAPPPADPDRRALAKDNAAVPLPPHRPSWPSPSLRADREPPRAQRIGTAVPRPVASSSRAHPLAAAAPVEHATRTALIPPPEPPIEPIFGTATRPDAFATRRTTIVDAEPVAPAEAVTARAQAEAPAPERPAAVVKTAAQEPPAAPAPAEPAPQAAAAPVAAEEPAASVASPADSPRAVGQAAAATPASVPVVEKPTIVAALAPEALPRISAEPSAPRPPSDDTTAILKPASFPPALDVIAVLMLTAPARR